MMCDAQMKEGLDSQFCSCECAGGGVKVAISGLRELIDSRYHRPIDSKVLAFDVI